MGKEKREGGIENRAAYYVGGKRKGRKRKRGNVVEKRNKGNTEGERISEMEKEGKREEEEGEGSETEVGKTRELHSGSYVLEKKSTPRQEKRNATLQLIPVTQNKLETPETTEGEVKQQ